MTLRGAVLFPHALMPIHIFEPRYRTMLRDVLQQDRIFAIATLDESDTASSESIEAPHTIASVGIVRACIENPNGSSELILQGIARIQIEQIICESPYRKILIQQIFSEYDGSPEVLKTMQPTLLSLLNTQRKLGAEIPQEVLQFLGNLSTPETVLDLAIHALCSSTQLRVELLETRGVVPRYRKFCVFLNREIERLKLHNHLRNGMKDDQIGLN
jgi:Lon protease-like protein